MATIFILLGSMLGFITAVTLYVSLDTSLTAALLVWGASGPLSALVVILLSYEPATPQPVQSDDQMAKIA